MCMAFVANCSASTTSPGGAKVTVGYGGVIAPMIGKERRKDEGVLRVDWLLDRTILVGLEKDEAFAAHRLHNLKDRSNVWVVTLASNMST